MSSEKSNTQRSSSYSIELEKEDKTKYKRKLTLTNANCLIYMELLRIRRAMWSSCMMSLGVTCAITLQIHLVNTLMTTWKLTDHWKLSTFLCTTMFETFIIMKLQKNLNFAVSHQRYKNIYLNIFIKSLF